MASPTDLTRLAHHVEHRRLDLRLSRAAAVKAAGMSKDTWMRVERGQPVREVNYAKIDKVLEWAPGSCLSVAAGQEPVPLTGELAPGHYGAKVTEAPDVDAAAAVQRSVESASIAVTDHLTAQEIRDLSARVVADLKKQGIIP
ncbi:helix-turn-helix transcriptional regulator [Streptomyces sp. NPDC045456]|uniref:helix-turn-helix domain-containing protein n=1 Tax=Streptomyces sp. NPDC045456 TaxID=3155254 RepID=UPI0033D19B3D